MIRPLTAALALLLAAPLTASAATHPAPRTVTLSDGLKYTDLTVGHGPVARAGDTATVHYVGTLTNGKKFDSSRDRNEPFSFALGAHQVIPCWDQGVVGMHVGGRRRLVCPPDLAYGAAGAGNGIIPPNATLDFDVELLGVKKS